MDRTKNTLLKCAKTKKNLFIFNHHFSIPSSNSPGDLTITHSLVDFYSIESQHLKLVSFVGSLSMEVDKRKIGAHFFRFLAGKNSLHRIIRYQHLLFELPALKCFVCPSISVDVGIFRSAEWPSMWYRNK